MSDCGNGNGCGPAYGGPGAFAGCRPGAPCAPSSVAQESTGSMIENLSYQLFGTPTKSITDGRIIWSTPCTPNTSGLPGLAKVDGEGFICYLLRVMTQIGLFNGGVWVSTATYPPQTVVAEGPSLYVSLQANTNVQPGTDTSVWMLLLTAPTGPKGAQGDPGPSGGSDVPAYGTQETTSDVTLTNDGDALICENTAPITVTIPAGSTLTSGKRYLIKQAKAAAQVTITMTGSDTVEGAATYFMNTPGESITIVQSGTSGRFFIF